MNDEGAHAPSGRQVLVRLGVVAVVLLAGLGIWLASRPGREQLEGMVDAHEINVATKALARVDRLLVEEGERVQQGQLLAALSSPEISGGRAQAEGALAAARALQDETNAGPRVEDIASLRSAWLAAAAAAQLAEATSRRVISLNAQGVLPAQRRDEAAAARDTAARQAEAARQQYLKGLAGSRVQNRQAAAAQVRVAEAALGTAQALTAETRLVSPVAGEVSRRLVEPGEVVGPVIPAYQVIDIDHPWISLNLREDRYAGISRGRVLRGTVPALGRQGEFVIYRISPRADFATWRATREDAGYDIRAFEIRLRPRQPLPGLRPGMSVLFDWPQ